MIDRVRAGRDERRKRGGLTPAHEGKDRGLVVCLAGPIVFAAAVARDEEDGRGKVVLGKDRDGVVDEIGEAVVECNGDRAGPDEDLIERNDGNSCCGEAVHVAAEYCRRHGDDRTGVVDGVIRQNCRSTGLDHDLSVGQRRDGGQ